MKNLKVSVKLIFSFMLIAILTLAVGIMGITGMLQIEQSGVEMYENVAVPTPYLARVQETLQNIRVYVREMVIASMAGDMTQVESSFSVIGSLMPVMANNLDIYDAALTQGSEAKRLFDEARSLYENDLTQTVLAIYAASQVADVPVILEHMVTCRLLSERILKNFDDCLDLKVAQAERASSDSTALARLRLIMIIAMLIIALAAAVFLAFYISSLISKPLVATAQFFKQAATTGQITCPPEINEMFNRFKENKDEIGQLITDCDSFMDSIIHVSKELAVIAEGDLALNIETLSENDTIGVSLKKVVTSLNGMFSEIQTSTSQVSAASKQIADGSQALAQGATEQAAVIQQLSSSISEIAQKTNENADMAGRAASLANTIKGSAEKGSRQMNEMMEAVREINVAGQSISKVIKVIDDIAFQTNILALNAAVEAARAGQHGKGFAVVAEEVRNLAAKSAEAAKDTGSLIANSIEKAELGSRIAEETSSSLAEIVSGINESDQIVGEIARSSEEQSLSITEINKGIDQVAHVVQQNSATAEQSAAASQEMDSQSNMLEELLSRFKLNKNSTQNWLPSSGTPAKNRITTHEDELYTFSGPTDSFGKY